MDRSPPSSRPPVPDGFDNARGTLRDALGALGNLAQLAGSAKVGSKAIEPVLPDVLASVGPMRTAVREIVGALRPSVADSPVADELEVHFLSRIAELEHELGGIVAGPLRTAGRLGLDRLLGRLSSELDTAQCLLELVETASFEPMVPLRVSEVLRQRLPAAPGGRRPRRQLSARLAVVEVVPEAPLKPRTLAHIVGAIAELAGSDPLPAIVVRPAPDWVEVEVSSREPKNAIEIQFWAYGVIEPSRAAIQAAAQLGGFGLDVRPATTVLTVPLPR